MTTHLPDLLARIKAQNAMQAGLLDAAVASLPAEEGAELESYIAYFLADGADLDYLAASYDLIVKDTLREQLYFRRRGRYRFATYAEVAGSVYHDPDYMGKYMHGLALTAFLWPNHAAMRRYFLETLPKDKDGAYLEIGPGHGLYMMSAMRRTRYATFEGVDISATSVALTRRILGSGHFGTFTDYRVRETDFLAASFEHRYDAIVMGEVLEHVEDPGRFLQRIRTLSQPGSYIFITTCINSPAYDHIYLFTSPEHLAGIIGDAGLSICDQLVLPYHGTTLAQSAQERLPVNIALVLQG